jgi:hypothetical protein
MPEIYEGGDLGSVVQQNSVIPWEQIKIETFYFLDLLPTSDLAGVPSEIKQPIGIHIDMELPIAEEHYGYTNSGYQEEDQNSGEREWVRALTSHDEIEKPSEEKSCGNDGQRLINLYAVLRLELTELMCLCKFFLLQEQFMFHRASLTLCCCREEQ